MNAGAREPSGARATDTLLKMLALERRRRYDDRAVSGGLDVFLRRALGGGTPPPAMLTAVAALPQRGYGSLSPGERARWATQAAGLLRGGQSSRPPRARGGPGGPAAAHRPAAHRPAPHQRRARTAPPTIEAGRHPLETPVAALGRVGGGTIQTLKRVGVESVGDLLWYFPARHSDFTNVKAIAALVVGEQATVVGQVRSARVAPIGRRRSSEAVIEDESGRIRALWFNQPYLAKSLAEGATVGLAGKVSAYRGRLQFDSPEWEILAGPGESVEAEEASTHVGRLVPVYPLTQGLPQRRVRQLARAALDRYLTYVPEALPPEVLDETRYLPAQDAIRELHFPASAELREAARERLAFEELLAIQLAVVRRKRDAKARQDAPVITLDGAFLQRFIEALPFQLTGAQMRALTEIRTDLGQPEPMARLLQGDVGSGKTVIAAAAMLGAVAAGRQAVLMAPTEVLAEQHYRTLSGLFSEGPAGSPFHDYSVSPALGRPVRMALLTGSTALARKRALQDALHGGDLEIAVGTHALIQERVGFDRLGVAVVDEQHRFGVLQRDALRGKGGSPAPARDDGHADPAHARPHGLRRPGRVPPGRTPAGTAAGGDPLHRSRRAPTGVRARPRRDRRGTAGVRDLSAGRGVGRGERKGSSAGVRAAAQRRIPGPGRPHAAAPRAHERVGEGAGDGGVSAERGRDPRLHGGGGGRRGRAQRQPDRDRGGGAVRALAVAPISRPGRAERPPVVLLSPQRQRQRERRRSAAAAGEQQRRLRAGGSGPADARPRRILRPRARRGCRTCAWPS